MSKVPQKTHKWWNCSMIRDSISLSYTPYRPTPTPIHTHAHTSPPFWLKLNWCCLRGNQEVGAGNGWQATNGGRAETKRLCLIGRGWSDWKQKKLQLNKLHCLSSHIAPPSDTSVHFSAYTFSDAFSDICFQLHTRTPNYFQDFSLNFSLISFQLLTAQSPTQNKMTF